MFLPSAMDLKELVRTPSDDGTILRVRTLTALVAAVATATGETQITTGNITIPSTTPEETIQAFYGELQQAGLKINYVSPLVFTLTWQR
jgi:hypothetical protein